MQGLYLKRSIWEKICPKTKALHFNGARVPLSSVLQNPLDELNDHEGSFFAAGTFGIGNTAGYYDRHLEKSIQFPMTIFPKAVLHYT